LYDLIAIGNPVYDEIITPYIRTEGRVLSGGSTNACLVAKKLGVEHVALIGCIGKDYESQFKVHMAKYGVELPQIKISENTGGFRLNYDIHGDRELSIIGVAGNISTEDIPHKCLDAKFILIAPILQEVDLELIQFLSKNSTATLFLDPQGLIREIGDNDRIVKTCNRRLAAEFTSLVDVVKPNEIESVVLTHLEDPYMAAKQLVEWGTKISIVTLAERGSIISDGKSFIKIPAYQTIARDPTGAGDTYAGAFIAEQLRLKSLFDCGLFASAAASIKVEYTGPDFPLTKEEITRRAHKINFT